MSRHGVRSRAAAGCAAVILGVAGCSSSSADGPDNTTGSTGPSASVIDLPSTGSGASGSSSPTAPTPSVIDVPTVVTTQTSLDPDAQEAADRAAVEAQWTKFWQTYNGIVRTPEEQRSKMLDAVSVDPVKTEILNAAKSFESQGLDYFGSVVTHPYWVTPVDGKPIAVMRDCQDQSQYGSIYVASGEKRSIGVEHNSLQAGFVLGTDGIWRVQNFDHLGNVPC